MKKAINQIKKLLANIDNNYFYILVAVLIISAPLISKKYLLGHDTLYHIANIDAITVMLKNFNFSKITPIIANNLGYGGSIFYPKLPHYFAAIINLFFTKFDINVVYSLKLSHILVSLLSAIFMYKLLNMILKNKKAALLGSILYITMPYFVNDIYVRGAFNESFIFIFMPIIFIGLINIYNDEIKKFYIYFIIGYLGMINSHLVMSVYFTIPVLVFLLINKKKFFTLKNLKHLIISSITILILIAPSMVLLIEHKSTGLYGVFDSNLVHANAEAVKKYSLSLSDYVIPRVKSEDDTYYFVNFIALILAIFGIINLLKNEKNKNIKNNMFGIIAFLLISILLSLKYFPYQYLPKLLLSIQFGFRCMSFSIFAISILAGYGLLFFKDNYRKIIIDGSILFSFVIAIIYINNTNFIPAGNIINWDKYAGMGAQKEYLTKNSLNNIDYFDKRENDIKIISKNQNIKLEKLKDNIPYLEFSVTNIKESDIISLELPRLYYLGYEIEQIQDNNKSKILDYKINKNGFIQINVKKDGIIKVKYKGTKLYNFLRIIRLIFIIGLMFLCYKKNIRRLKKQNI